jgi:hypothetical protein
MNGKKEVLSFRKKERKRDHAFLKSDIQRAYITVTPHP